LVPTVGHPWGNSNGQKLPAILVSSYIGRDPATAKDNEKPPNSQKTLLPRILRTVLNLERLLKRRTNEMANKSESSESSVLLTPPKAPTVAYVGIMPRPGQSESLDVFTGQNALDYLDDFNVECELYRVKPEQRILLFLHYCIPSIKDVVKLLPGYETKA
jgi:hypothetical protein